MHLDVSFDLDLSLAAGRSSGGRRLANGGMALSAKTSLRFGNAALNWSLTALLQSLLNHYFGLNDDLEQITRCIDRDDYIKTALHRFEGLRIVQAGAMGMPHQLYLRNLQKHSSHPADAKQDFRQVW